MHLLNRTLQAALVALTFVVATTMMTTETNAQVIHVGPGGGGVHWSGGSVHWGGNGGVHPVGGFYQPQWGGGLHHGGIQHGGIHSGIQRRRWSGGHFWHNTSHLDWHSGQYVPHNGHVDYVPGHWDVHKSGHWDHH